MHINSARSYGASGTPIKLLLQLPVSKYATLEGR